MGLIGPISTMSQHNMPEGLRQGVELCACGEQRLALHLLFYLLGFHLRSSLQALFHGLRRETLLIGALDGLASVVVVAEHEDGIVGQEGEQRRFLLCHAHLRHDGGLLATLLRQLILHLEGADGVDVVAEEVDAERILVAEAEYVEDAAAQGKLSGLVNVVYLAETQLTQFLQHLLHIYCLSLSQRQRVVVKLLARHHHLGQGFRERYNVEPTPIPSPREGGGNVTLQRLSRGKSIFQTPLPWGGVGGGLQLRQHLCAQDFVGRVFLSVFHGPLVAGGEEQHVAVAHLLRQVVVKIACLLSVLQDEEKDFLELQRSEDHRRRRGRQPLKGHPPHFLIP